MLLSLAAFLGPHLGKEDDIPDTVAVCQKHDNTVDPDSETSCWRKTILERPDVVLVDRVNLFVVFLQTEIVLVLETLPASLR